MAKKPDYGPLIGLGLLVAGGLGLAIAVASGDTIEEKISNVVKALNDRFGNGWGTLAFDAIQAAIKPDFWSIATVVFDVEQMALRHAASTRTKLTAAQKHAAAVARLKPRR